MNLCFISNTNMGILRLDGLVTTASNETKSETAKTLLSKQDKSCGTCQDDHLRASKLCKSDVTRVSKSVPLQQQHGPSLLRSNASIVHNESIKPEASSFLSKDAAFPYITSAGYGTGTFNASMHGSFTEIRGPFTPSQWMELQHQAFIYKYINANVPIPSNLLVPLKKSLYPYSFPGARDGSFSFGSFGWGCFHLGYPGNSSEPEPGRCRRTDGKKWRCSRDAVPDQKYCERHMNRGRHRSRKPVEGQTGRTITGMSDTKMVPVTSPIPTSVVTADSASICATMQQHFKNLHSTAASALADVYANRAQYAHAFSTASSNINPKPDESRFGIPKQEVLVRKGSCQREFGLVSSDSLVNPLLNCTYGNSENDEPFVNFSDHNTSDQQLLHQFIDGWPENHSSRTTISWPEELNSDWTQLSMSLPIAVSDFSSSSSPLQQEKLSLSPLMSSHEFDLIQMGLGATYNMTEPMDGPLGEVLSTSTSNTSSCQSSKALNQSFERWDGCSYLGYSPGLLQKATAGSWTRAECKKYSLPRDDCKFLISS